MDSINRDVLSNILTFSRGDHIFHASTSKQFREISNINETEFVSESRTLEQVKSVWEIKPSNEFVEKVIKLGKKDILEFMVSKGLTFDFYKLWTCRPGDFHPDLIEWLWEKLNLQKEGFPVRFTHEDAVLDVVYGACYAGVFVENFELVEFCINKGCEPNESIWNAFEHNLLEKRHGKCPSTQVEYDQKIVEILYKNSCGSGYEGLFRTIKEASRDGNIDTLKLFLFLKDDPDFFWETARSEAEKYEQYCFQHEKYVHEHNENDEDYCWLSESGNVAAWLDKNGL